MVRQREEREAVEAQKSVQITRLAHHPFPKWAVNRTFSRRRRTDAVDPFETLGTLSSTGAYWQPATSSVLG